MGVAVGDYGNDDDEDLSPGTALITRTITKGMERLDGFPCLVGHKDTRLRLPVLKRCRPCAAGARTSS